MPFMSAVASVRVHQPCGIGTRRILLVAAVLLVAGASSTIAQESTQGSLTAPRADKQIKLELKGKVIRFAIDDSDSFHQLLPTQLIVASHPVKITIPNLNPLTYQYSVDREEAPDPANSALVKLVESFLELPGIFNPDARSASIRSTARAEVIEKLKTSVGTCQTLQQAEVLIGNLDKFLFPEKATPTYLRGEFGAWEAAITKQPGPQAIAEVRDKLANLIGDKDSGLKTAVQKGDEATKALEEQLERQVGHSRTASLSSVAAQAASTKAAEQTPTVQSLDAEIDALRRQLQLDDQELAARASNTCEVIAHLLLQVAHLTNPRLRVQQLTALIETLTQINEALAAYADEKNWLSDRNGGNRTNYVIYDELRPSSATMQRFSIKAVRLRYQPTATALTVAKEEVGAGAFTVRAFRRFTAEIGTGLVLSDIKRPKYGTATNEAGETVVGAAKLSEESYDAAIVTNFVCRCGWGDEFAPMIQIGVAPRPSSPSILLGGGFRLFALGKGNVAVGVGAIMAWVKDLTELEPGDKVTGTKDIESDLSYQRRVRPYVALLYSF